MKKVLAAALVCAASASATWDYFPVNPAGEGEIKAGVEYNLEAEALDFGIQARYSIIEGLEAAIFFSSPAEEIELNLGIGVRYWLSPNFGFFVDATLPIDVDFDLTPGVQFSTEFTPEFSLGSELGVLNLLNDADIGLAAGMELDYSIGKVTAFIGTDMLVALDETEFFFTPFAGLVVEISESFAIDAGVAYDIDGEALSISASAAFSF